MAISKEVQDALAALVKMSEDDLRYINQAIVGHLKARRKVVARSFDVGDRVSFAPRGAKLTGKIVATGQLNHKVVTDEGAHWRVSASLLTHI